MKLIRHGNGKYSCIADGATMHPVPGRANAGLRRCPVCGRTIRLPKRPGYRELGIQKRKRDKRDEP